MSAPVVELDPLLGSAGATAMVELCERVGRYRTYATEHVDSEIGRGLAQRHDAVLNFLRSGGRHGKHASTAELAARTNYFREEYAYGERVLAPGIEPFLHHEGFVEAARAVHGRPVVEPAIVYANLLVPGQELAVHTDVPEFRGMNRKVVPQWLIVAMHHSGLFDDHRMPIATGIAWFHDAVGGELAFYPDGPDGDAVVRPVSHDTALVLDTDSVFHGVDRVGGADASLPALGADVVLEHAGGDDWVLRRGDDVVARHRWDDLRFSVSWKAYCFADEAERTAWHDHADDLGVDVVVDRLVDDLRERGRIEDEVPGHPGLALTIIDEYIHFPSA